jgi:hypothetical protein
MQRADSKHAMQGVACHVLTSGTYCMAEVTGEQPLCICMPFVAITVKMRVAKVRVECCECLHMAMEVLGFSFAWPPCCCFTFFSNVLFCSLSRLLARWLSRNVPPDAGFLSNKTSMLGDVIKGTASTSTTTGMTYYSGT